MKYIVFSVEAMAWYQLGDHPLLQLIIEYSLFVLQGINIFLACD